MRKKILGALAGIAMAVGLLAAPAAAAGFNTNGYFVDAGFSGRPCTINVQASRGYNDDGTSYGYVGFERYGPIPQCQSFPFRGTYDTIWVVQQNFVLCYNYTVSCGPVYSHISILSTDLGQYGLTYGNPTINAPNGFYFKANFRVWRATAPGVYAGGVPGGDQYWTLVRTTDF